MGTDFPGNDRLAQASDWFVRVRADDTGAEALPHFQQWLHAHPENAAAYKQIAASWGQLDAVASMPEMVVARRDALESARLASVRGWGSGGIKQGRGRLAMAAAVALVAVSAGFFLWSGQSQGTKVYETGLGERRILTLADGSVVNLDARSRMRVAYSGTRRSITLEAGQARFDVAKDSGRPFVVHAGEQTVRALGTEFNIEVMPDRVLVTLIEGLVAVSEGETGPRPIRLTPGQQLIAEKARAPQLLSDIDVARATSWQNGKLFFDNEPLASAAARMNRYAQAVIEVDASVSDVGISGIFNVGDIRAFTEAVTTYFPVRIESPNGPGIRLTAR